jgi:hypothetical protein
VFRRLIDKRGRDTKIIDWLDESTAECAKKVADCGGVTSMAEDVASVVKVRLGRLL